MACSFLASCPHLVIPNKCEKEGIYHCTPLRPLEHSRNRHIPLHNVDPL